MPYMSGDPGSPSASGEGNLNKCSQLYEALTNCHRRIRGGLDREIACRHLNRSLAQCLVAEVCPDESDAVRSLCSSGGTAIKRQQCREAQVEGDFKSFKGKWILEQLGSDHTQLKYRVESKVHKNAFLSEAIMEEVIHEDLPSNQMY
ncbi:unnamed protein product [Cuscuta campestris]|uniref:COX assembly mitochondrial protein n=1 Tax=Cuscuta campestris TaxID=132261 RepID=A0A484NJ17_9ASTE|nr:unnamed protein product [Cuscuta campestris]